MLAPIFSNAPVGTLGACAFALGLAAAVITDLSRRRIPNAIVLTLAVAGIAYSATSDGFASGLARSVGGLGTGLILWFPLFVIGALGAGDVKLFAAAAAWLGPERALLAALLAALSGGVLAMAWLVRVNGVKTTAAQLTASVASARRIALDPRSDRAIPYGVALAAGAAGAAWFPQLIIRG